MRVKREDDRGQKRIKAKYAVHSRGDKKPVSFLSYTAMGLMKY